MQQDDLPIWLALKYKFERLHVATTSCRPSVICPRDQDDPHDDAHPKGENSAKRQKTSEHGTFVFRESSSGQDYKSKPGPSTSGNQEQLDDFDFWTDSYATDDNEIPTEKVSQELVDEMSQFVDEAKLRKVNDIVWESRKEIIVAPYPQRPTPVVQSCQRDLKAPALSLVNQDLLYLKKGSSRPVKIVMSLYKFSAVIFFDDDIEEITSRWVDKYVEKFNPYARYNVKHWKNPLAKIFYIKKQKEPRKPKEVIVRRANGSIVSITESDYKNLNKNDIEDMYLLIVNGKVWKAINRRSILLHQQSLSQALRSTWCSPSSLSPFLEGLKSYNNNVKHGYVNPSLSNEDAEYLQLFEEEIDEWLKHRDQMRHWEMYVNGRPLGSRRKPPE
ncbi:hypothetical protein Tco_0745247 [Tanacetum coccineum]